MFLIGVTVTVDNSTTGYMANEASGIANITISLDQPSCQPIIVIAHPRVRLLAGDYATGTISYFIVSPLPMREIYLF